MLPSPKAFILAGFVTLLLNIFIQWTPILVTLAQNIPGPMVMSDLTAQSQSTRRSIRRKADPNKPVSIPIPERRLVMNLNGSKPSNYDQMVQQYQESLNDSPVLKPKIKEIIPSKEAGIGSDQSESYIMNIILASDSR